MTKHHSHYDDESVCQSARAMAPAWHSMLDRAVVFALALTPAGLALYIINLLIK